MDISLSPGNALQAAAGADNAVAPSTAPVTANTSASAALAKDSLDGQIRQLRQQGTTLSQISVDVDLSISAVGTDLLINVPRIPAITRTPPPDTPSVSLSA